MKILFAIGCLTLSLAGCGEDPGAGSDNPQQDEGGIRFLHVHAAEPGPLDLLVRSRETEEEYRIDGVDLHEASQWTAVPAGIYTLLLFRSGTSEVISALSADNISIQEDLAKTIIAGQNSTGEPRTTQINDDITETNAPSENHGRLRFIHMAQAGLIDLYEDEQGTRLATAIQNGALEDYQELPSGRYDLTVASDGLRDLVLARGEQVPLPPANVSTIVLVGNADPNGDGDTSDSAASILHIDDFTY